MHFFSSPWLLILSQSLLVLGVGCFQWTVYGAVTLTLPLLGWVVGLYGHLMLLRRWDRLPKMPDDMAMFWGIALGWSGVMVVTYCLGQPMAEIKRVAKVLPLLWLGIGLMDWVLMVCIQQLVGHLWDEETDDPVDYYQR